VDEDGIAHGARELRIEGPCSELLDAAALAIAIAIDPHSLTASPAPAPPETPESNPQPVLALPPPPAAAPPREDNPVRPDPIQTPARGQLPVLEASAGVVGSAGVAPSPALGLGVGAALRWSRVSVSLEARLDAPAGTDAPGGGRVSSWLALGAFVPCFHFGPA